MSTFDLPLAVVSLLTKLGAVVGYWDPKTYSFTNVQGNLKALLGLESLEAPSLSQLLAKHVRHKQLNKAKLNLAMLGLGRIMCLDLVLPTVGLPVPSLRLCAGRDRLEDKIVFVLEPISEQVDQLTRLPQRSSVMNVLPLLLQRSYEQRKMLMVGYGDLDLFKSINDAYGHETGNALLAAVADRLRHVVAKHCSICRGVEVDNHCLGHVVARAHGDEFVILLGYLDSEQQGEAIAKAIMDAINSERYETGMPNVEPLDVSASMGLAFGNTKMDKPLDLFDQADRAMRDAKTDAGVGPSHLATFKVDMIEKMKQDEKDRQRAAAALSRGDWLPVFHAFADLRTTDRDGRPFVIGAEVLVRPRGRWGNPDREKTFALMESRELTPTLLVPTLDQACNRLEEWQQMGGGSLYLSVNISARQITKEDLFKVLLNVLDRHPSAWSSLILEITERTELPRVPEIHVRLQELREREIHVALDDFGTGNANFATLAEYGGHEISMVKIPRLFLEGLVSTDPGLRQKARHVLKVLTSAVSTSGAIVIYEGIETQEQLRHLQPVLDDLKLESNGAKLSSIFGQGHLFGQPVPWEVFCERVLHEHRGFVRSL